MHTGQDQTKIKEPTRLQ